MEVAVNNKARAPPKPATWISCETFEKIFTGGKLGLVQWAEGSSRRDPSNRVRL